jgi:hypothetical protein
MTRLSSSAAEQVEEGLLARFKQFPWVLVPLLILGRLLTYLSMTLDGLRGYGDFSHFFQLAALPGWPYFNYWSEFPPIFPFLSAALYRLAGGQEHIYDYLLIFILLAADAGSLYLFIRLSRRLYDLENAPLLPMRSLAYFVILLTLAYSWWYFDPLAVFTMLLGVSLLLENRRLLSGLAFGLGLLVKFFPALGLIIAWRCLPWKKALWITALAVGAGILVYGGLWLASPHFTLASLQSQGSKGSWETVWALLDGNLATGLFGPEIERLNPALAGVGRGNPPRIPAWITLILLGAIGLWGFFKARRDNDLQQLALLGWCWSLFLLWSPGWSPQWLLYLLPLILLVLPEKRVFLVALLLVLVNLAEWPLLLSRGLFWSLYLTVPVRTLLLILVAALFYVEMTEKGQGLAQLDP